MGILATVNGVPISERDVDLRARAGVTGEVANHSASPNVLETVIRDELIFQKARELGLDRDEEYRLKVADLEAQVSAFRRQEMSARFRMYVQRSAAVTDAEARAYFEKNAEAIRTRFHVLQILCRGGLEEITRDHQDIATGKPFEEVASRRFPGLQPGGKAPWDLGELRWYQLPQSWRGIVDRLKPGEVSEVIKGEKDRFWVVRLVDRSLDPAVSFATEKERIVDVLRQGKATALYASMLEAMKGEARVVYSR